MWIPQISLEDGSAAFDVIDFYKSLLEWPIPLKVAGDFDGRIKEIRSRILNGR